MSKAKATKTKSKRPAPKRKVSKAKSKAPASKCERDVSSPAAKRKTTPEGKAAMAYTPRHPTVNSRTSPTPSPPNQVCCRLGQAK